MPGCGFHVGKKLATIASIGVLCERVVCPCKALNKKYQYCLCKRNCMIKERDHKLGPRCMVYRRYPLKATKPYSMYVKLGGFGCSNLSQTSWSSPYNNCAEDNNMMRLGCEPNNVLGHNSTILVHFPARKKRRCIRHVRAKAPSQQTWMTSKCHVKIRKKNKCNGLTSLASPSRKMSPKIKSRKLQSPYTMTKKRKERKCWACNPHTPCKEPNPKKKPIFLRNNEGPTAEQIRAWQEARAKAKCKSAGRRDLAVWGPGPILPPKKKDLECTRGIHRKKKAMSKDCQEKHDCCTSNPSVIDNNDLYLPDPKRTPMDMPDSDYFTKPKLRGHWTSPIQFQFAHDANNQNLCLHCQTSLYPSSIEVKTQNSLKCQSQSHRILSRSPISCRSRSNSPTQPKIQRKSPSTSCQLWHGSPRPPSLVYIDEIPRAQCKSPTGSCVNRSRSPPSPYSMFTNDTPQGPQTQCSIPSRSCQILPKSPPSPSSVYIDETPRVQCKSSTRSCQSQPKSPPSPSSVYIDGTPQAQCNSPTRSCQSLSKSPPSPSSMYIDEIPQAQCKSPTRSCQCLPKSPPSPSSPYIDETLRAQCNSPTRSSQSWPKSPPSPTSPYIDKTPRAQCYSATRSCQSRPKSPLSPSSPYIDETPRARCNLYISCKECHCHKSQNHINSCRRDTLCRYCPCHQKNPNMSSMCETSSICKPQGSPLFNCSMKIRSQNWDKVTHYTIQGTKTSFEVSPKVHPNTQTYIVETPPCSPTSLLVDTSQSHSPKFKSVVESSMDLPSQGCHECDFDKHNKGFMTTTYLKNLPSKQFQDCVCHNQNNGFTTNLQKNHLPNRRYWEQDNNMNFTSYPKYSLNQSGSPTLEQPFAEEHIPLAKWQGCKLHLGFNDTSCDVAPPICQGHPEQNITYNLPISPMCALNVTRESIGTSNNSPRHIKTEDCPSLQCIYPTPQCVNCKCHKSLHASSTPPKYSLHEFSPSLSPQGNYKPQPHSLGHCASSDKHTEARSPTQPIATSKKKSVHVSSQCCNPRPISAYCHCHKGRAWQNVAPKKIRTWSCSSSGPPSEYESLMRGLQSCPGDLERECSTRLYSCPTSIQHNCCCGMCKSDGVPPSNNAMTCPNCNLRHSCCCGTCLCPNPCCACSPIYSSSSFSIYPTRQEVAFKLAPKSPPRPRQISSPKSPQKDIRDHFLVCPNSQAYCSGQNSAKSGLFSMMSQSTCSRPTSPSCLNHNSMQPQSCTSYYEESSSYSRAQWSPMSALANCCCQRCLNGEPCSSRRRAS